MLKYKYTYIYIYILDSLFLYTTVFIRIRNIEVFKNNYNENVLTILFIFWISTYIKYIQMFYGWKKVNRIGSIFVWSI